MTSANTPSNNASITTWLDWFQSRESGTKINQAHQEKLFTTFNSTVSKSDSIEAVIDHDETAYLQKASFGVGNITIFHHLKAVGGTIYDPNAKDFGFIQGLGKETAIILKPDTETLFKDYEGTAVATPSPTNILNVNSIEQVDNLTDSVSVTYSPRNFIPIPPFLLNTIHNSISNSNGNAASVLVDCVKEIKTFDTDHATDTDYKDKAKSKCKDIMIWLYLVHKRNDKIDAVPVMGCNNKKVAKVLSELSTNCLAKPKQSSSSISSQVEQSLKRPFEVLATSASSTSDFMEKLTQLQSQSNEKSSKSFKKIPQKYQNMILVASSVGEVTVQDYDADGAAFFKCSNNLNAQVMLNSLLETACVECSVSSALTATLLYGSFLWKNSMSPSGFAGSVISTEGIFRKDTLHEGMILDHATKFEMSASSLSKLTKTQVAYPIDAEEMVHRIKALHTLATFFFKRSGYMSQGLQQLVNFCTSNKMLLKTRIHLDNHFIAKLICAVDERIYMWLKQCSTCATVVDTDTSLMDLSSLIQDIQFNRFNYLLPPCVSKLNTQEDDNKETNKKKKFEAEKNMKLNTDWKLRQSESWDAIFMNKTNDSPFLSMGCRACLKFHVKGICYSDCRHKNSHVELNGEDSKKLSNHLKTLRGE